MMREIVETLLRLLYLMLEEMLIRLTLHGDLEREEIEAFN
jgi:hypothetical protein